jgi:hypothetical protein
VSFKQPPALHELQYDALGASLVDNPHLPASPIPSKNKALNTSKPYVTGAINELLQTIENIRNLVQTSLSQQQAVLGDFIADPTLLSDLQKVDSSVLKAIIKLSKMTQPESAYEIWLALGNTGSKEDFLNSLKGEKGEDGQDSALPGPAGTTATIEIGEVLTGEAGTAAVVQNVGTDTAARLNFTIPRGEKGLIGDVNLPGPLEDETIICDIDKLQEEIDKLPKFLNKNVTIKVNPGIYNGTIVIQNFFGFGSLTINGGTNVPDNHSIRNVSIDNCSCRYIDLVGFSIINDGSLDVTYDIGINVTDCHGAIYLNYLNITKGAKANTVSYNLGIVACMSPLVFCNNCTISNKSNAFNIQSLSRITVLNASGSDNQVCFLGLFGGSIQKHTGNKITGSVMDAVGSGSIIVNTSGIIQGT